MIYAHVPRRQSEDAEKREEMNNLTCKSCGHREVCKFAGLFDQYVERMEGAHKKYIEETEDILLSSKDKVFDIKPSCKYWKI